MPQFDKHFTLEEANAALPLVLSVFERVHELTMELKKKKKTLDTLHKSAPTNGGHKKGAELAAISDNITGLMSQLEAKGILIKDVDSGLVDFPHLRDGEEVLLCWRLGERKIGYWHDLESGYQGRQPL